MNWHHDSCRRRVRGWLSTSAVRNDNDSSTIANEQHADREAEVLELVRMAQLLDAFEDREQAAQR